MSFSLFIETLNSLWFRTHLQRPLKALKTTARNSNFRRVNLIDLDRRTVDTIILYRSALKRENLMKRNTITEKLIPEKERNRLFYVHLSSFLAHALILV